MTDDDNIILKTVGEYLNRPLFNDIISRIKQLNILNSSDLVDKDRIIEIFVNYISYHNWTLNLGSYDKQEDITSICQKIVDLALGYYLIARVAADIKQYYKNIDEILGDPTAEVEVDFSTSDERIEYRYPIHPRICISIISPDKNLGEIFWMDVSIDSLKSKVSDFRSLCGKFISHEYDSKLADNKFNGEILQLYRLKAEIIEKCDSKIQKILS